MSPEACLPWWYEPGAAEGGCPYGLRLPGDVSLPRDADLLQWIAVVYSYVPYCIVIGVVLDFLVVRGTRQLSLLAFTALTTLLNEWGAKPLVQQMRPGAAGPAPAAKTGEGGRPVGSCNVTCGMPSSHATMAMGFLMITVFDSIMRVAPSSDLLSGGGDAATRGARCSLVRLVSLTPLSPKPVMDQLELLALVFTWLVLLGPVPLMRVILHDHSAPQVFVGSFLGCVYGALWFQIVAWLVERHKTQLGGRVFFGLLLHNYCPAGFEVQVKSGDGWQAVDLPARIVEAPPWRRRGAPAPGAGSGGEAAERRGSARDLELRGFREALPAAA